MKHKAKQKKIPYMPFKKYIWNAWVCESHQLYLHDLKPSLKAAVNLNCAFLILTFIQGAQVGV